jgi:metal-responsive CopG/Arc/MetJ family transcriptional regulator
METITISVPEKILAEIDDKRGDVPRSAFLRKIILKALEGRK